MRLNRESREQFLRARQLYAGVLLLGLGGTAGCSSEPLYRDEPINCSTVEADYDFDPMPATFTFSCYYDGTPDGGGPLNPTVGDGPCGSKSALGFISSHNNDWGSTCNGSTFGPIDRSNYEGFSFWARAAAGTSQGFTFSLYDANDTLAPDPTHPNAPGGHCKNYNATDGGIAGSTTVVVTDPQTNQVLSGVAVASRQPDECGNNKTNSFDYVMAVTNEWALYTIPWSKFTQGAFPNRAPNSVLDAGTVPGTGLLTTELYSLGIRPPKEAPFELWIDKLSFYRQKLHDAGPDTEPDAPPAAVLDSGSGTGLDAALDLELSTQLDAELATVLDAEPGTQLDADLSTVLDADFGEAPSVDVN
jgi:hypothetical protein